MLKAWSEKARAELRLHLLTEPSGSQVACRKISELKRDCGLVMVADNALVAKLLSNQCSWRMDFARDEVVLAVGARAHDADKAENDWPSVLQQPDVRISRVDENQGPIGYRTLLVWKLQEQLGSPGLYATLIQKCDKVVDHVTRLTPLLKTGEIDYAFVYRSICVARDIRFIELDQRINLGADTIDYANASVTFRKSNGKTIAVKGAPITWALSIPDRDANTETAQKFIAWSLELHGNVLKQHGFRPFNKPKYFGPESSFTPFAAFAEYGGKME